MAADGQPSHTRRDTLIYAGLRAGEVGGCLRQHAGGFVSRSSGLSLTVISSLFVRRFCDSSMWAVVGDSRYGVVAFR